MKDDSNILAVGRKNVEAVGKVLDVYITWQPFDFLCLLINVTLQIFSGKAAASPFEPCPEG